jgi:hypothetical protein
MFGHVELLGGQDGLSLLSNEKKVPVSRHLFRNTCAANYLPSNVPVAPNSRRATVLAGRAMGRAPAAAP